jgi:hypothetical protein
MSNVSNAFPNWQLGARSPQAAMDALYFITTVQQSYTSANTFVYAQGLGTLVANQMAAAMPTAKWPSAPQPKIDGWILDSVRHLTPLPSSGMYSTSRARYFILPTTLPSGSSARTP